jgi:FkbM family methyltransferase
MDARAQPPNEERYIRSRGLLFPDDRTVLGRKVRRLLRARDYETKEYEAVRALVGPEDTVMELGAGIGFMSTVAARLCKVRAVTAYEANPALIPYIRAVHAANGVTDRVTVRNALLAGAAGDPVDFYVRKNLLASSMEPMQGDRDGGVVSTASVPVEDINAALRDIAPSILICDIEGAEADLLPRADLSGLRAAIVELHPQWIGQTGVQAVFDSMHRAGLTYFPKRSNAKVVTFRKGW